MSTDKVKRKTSVFEIILLIVGISIIASGVHIFNLLAAEGYGLLDNVTFVMLWLLLIFLVIICAITENSREELGVLVNENSKEIKLLRQISKEHLDEIKLLRETLAPKVKGKK